MGQESKIKEYKYKENKYGYIVLASDFLYRQYKKSADNAVTYKEYVDMVRDVMAEVWRVMAEELWRFNVPYLNNEIFIMELMGHGAPTNWNLSIKKRKKIISPNLHTSGRLFKIVMRKTHKSINGTRAYKFLPTRGSSDVEFIGKRGLAAYIKRCATTPTMPDFRGHID